MTELIEPFIGTEFDISKEIFSKYPTKIICQILGIPEERLGTSIYGPKTFLVIGAMTSVNLPSELLVLKKRWMNTLAQ